ncbi:MAG: ATP-binding protein [Mariprofundaceae bacterium]|nr:ATP-binding protein [Mariprofundaceae bacterium]
MKTSPDIFHNLKLMFSGDARYQSDSYYQLNVVTMVMYIALPTVLLFGFINYAYARFTLATVEFITTALLCISIYMLKHDWFLSLARWWLMMLSIAVFTALFVDGGIGDMGAYWSLVYPFLAFALMGARIGWAWVGLFMVIESAVFIMNAGGILNLPYSADMLSFFPVMLLFFTAIANVFEVQQERQQGEILEARDHLHRARDKLDEQVKEKTRALVHANEHLKKEIEERKHSSVALAKSEHNFRQAQKMEAIGTLVGGIAHDFNNMLAGVMAHLYMLDRKLTGEPDAKERLGKINQLLTHAADMIKQLMTFARKDSVEFKSFDFSPFLKEAYKLSGISIPEHIHVSCDFPSHPVYIMGDTTQLQQILMNLMNNARDAMRDVKDPAIHVKMSVVDSNTNFRSLHPEIRSEQFVCLSVTDNGSGIPKDKIDNIFEPFFTTKEVGKGTGLGLAMVFGAVQTHGGFIDVDSTEGKGTTFHLYIPVLDEKKQLNTMSQSDSFVPGFGETLLLVDDDNRLLEANRDVLTSLGYNVLTANNGLEAVELFNRKSNDIHMVIMDVVMPKLSGPVAASRMQKVRGDFPILFVTGYDRDGSLAGNIPVDREHVLEKPFTAGQLSRRIRRSLDTLKQTSTIS